MKTTKNAVATAREAVESVRQKLAQWEADEASAQAELMSLQQRAGEEILDDPEAATALPRQMQALRDRIDIAQRAVAAQASRVTDAERAYLTAEADALEQVVVVARGRLDAHQERTDELLALLAEHDGRTFVPERFQMDPGGGVVVRKTPTGVRLTQELARAEARVQVVRELAEGRDAGAWLQSQTVPGFGTIAGVNPVELYPACVWGPDAVVPAPAYLHSAQDGSAEVAPADAVSASV